MKPATWLRRERFERDRCYAVPGNDPGGALLDTLAPAPGRVPDDARFGEFAGELYRDLAVVLQERGAITGTAAARLLFVRAGGARCCRCDARIASGRDQVVVEDAGDPGAPGRAFLCRPCGLAHEDAGVRELAGRVAADGVRARRWRERVAG